MNRSHLIASFLCIAYINSITAGFLAGTLVKTDSSSIPIDQLSLRTVVSCYDVTTQEIKTRPVTRILKQKISRYKRIGIGTTAIDTSFGQLFYLPLSRTWIASQYLKVGDTLLTSSNAYAVIDFIEQINEEAICYEVSVFEYRNLYVSNQEILVHNFPGVIIGAALWYGGGFELTGYGALSICGLIVGGIAALCKRTSKLHHQEQHITSQESISKQPIVAYQSPYSNTPINLTPTDSTITTNNYPRDCFNQAAEYPNSLTTQPEYRTDKIILLMGKNNNHKKPKQKNNRPLPASGNPNGEDPRNNNNFYKKNSPNQNVNQHPHGKYGGASYHHKNSRGGTGKGAKSPAPIDGQAALDNSIQIKATSPHRIGISEGEIVFLTQTSKQPELIFHGHVRKWDNLKEDIQTLIEEAVENGQIKGPIPIK